MGLRPSLFLWERLGTLLMGPVGKYQECQGPCTGKQKSVVKSVTQSKQQCSTDD